MLGEFLAPQIGVLEEAAASGDPVLAYVAIWAILHAVPFSQLPPNRTHLLFYEDCLPDPEGEMTRLHDHSGHGPEWRTLPQDVIDRPSASSKPGEVGARHKSPYGAWKTRASAAQIEGALGLGALYDSEGRPDRATLAGFRIGGA
ncbi:hypothetical protein JMM63_01530 [Rhodovulum sulfidophilum]|uniref:hypothetical protein n=1 Tax=Rhodovulum sulfidophilum TaxID=35806 RepID=UPI001922565B|nr:hypothetical protein [Rhodovulum sulfidophilum]MBL3594271.1 hypothetical protein [Rhodovulum sulfidophilum]